MRKKSNFYQRGEIATLLTIAAMVVVGLSVFISSVVTNRDPRTTSTSAVEGCNPYPTEPTTPNPRATSTERGYYWEANCNQSCTQNSECPKNTSQGEVYADTSNWCYGFSGGAKCMMLKYGLRPAGGATPTPVPPQATATPAGGICQAVGQACQEDYEYQNLSCHKRGGTCTCVGGGTCCSWGPGSCCGPIGSNCLAPTTAPTNAPTAIPPTPTNVPYVPPPVPPGSCGNLANGQTVCSNGVPVTCTDGNIRAGSCPTNQTCPDGYARCQVINPTVQKCSDVTPVSSNYKNCTDVSHCGVLEKLGVRLTCVDGTALQPSVMPLCEKDANGKYPRFIWHWGALGSPADKKIELCPTPPVATLPASVRCESQLGCVRLSDGNYYNCNSPYSAPGARCTPPQSSVRCESQLGCVRLSDGNYYNCNSPYSTPGARCTPSGGTTPCKNLPQGQSVGCVANGPGGVVGYCSDRSATPAGYYTNSNQCLQLKGSPTPRQGPPPDSNSPGKIIITLPVTGTYTRYFTSEDIINNLIVKVYKTDGCELGVRCRNFQVNKNKFSYDGSKVIINIDDLPRFNNDAGRTNIKYDIRIFYLTEENTISETGGWMFDNNDVSKDTLEYTVSNALNTNPYISVVNLNYSREPDSLVNGVNSTTEYAFSELEVYWYGGIYYNFQKLTSQFNMLVDKNNTVSTYTGTNIPFNIIPTKDSIKLIYKINRPPKIKIKYIYDCWKVRDGRRGVTFTDAYAETGTINIDTTTITSNDVQLRCQI